MPDPAGARADGADAAALVDSVMISSGAGGTEVKLRLQIGKPDEPGPGSFAPPAAAADLARQG